MAALIAMGNMNHGGEEAVLNHGYLQLVLKSFLESEPCWKAAIHVTTREVVHNVQTLLKDLKSCSIRRDLQWGRRIHQKAVENQHESNIYVVTALIRMYAKCGSMGDARRLFDSVQKADVVCWTALLMGYVENEDGNATLQMYSKMKACGCAPDSFTYVAALKACTVLANGGRQDESLKRGRELHFEIGCNLDIFVQNTLIDMYSKSGSMVDAHGVFDSIQKPNVVSWTALLMGYAQNGDDLATLELFSKMKACGCAPDSFTYVAALKACTSLAEKGDGDRRGECLKRGRQIHSEIGSHFDIFVKNALIDMYAKCGDMEDAREVFESIRKPNVVCWNALLLGYASNGDGLVTLDLFSRMKACGSVPDSVTYIAALKACMSLAEKRDGDEQALCLRQGRQIHSNIGSNLDIFVKNTLINMYSKCGSMVEARSVFENIQKPNVVSWTALLLGYADNGDGLATLELFWEMKACGCAPDSVTYVAALKACTSLQAGSGPGECLKQGRQIHSEIGCELEISVQSTLIDMYSKCSSMEDAQRVFDSIKKPDVVCWTALLLGYVENGDGLATLKYFSKMKASGCPPDSVTFIAVIKACGLVGALILGRKYHSDISEFSAHVVTCLVDFYAKCGSMTEACEVFDLHSTARVVPTWNALLAGYGRFGDTNSVFNLFKAMQDRGIHPNEVTFLCILSCCSHAGLMVKAREYFEAMPVHYGVTPTVMHYNCMVDILGRGNQLPEAISVLQKMPCKPNAVTWLTVLGACRKWKNVDIGKWALQSLLDMDKKSAHAYVLIADRYGSRSMWEEQERVLDTKTAEQAYVTDQVGNVVKFVAGEEYPSEVEAKLEQLLGCVTQRGYFAESRGNVADTKKEEVLCGHSEKRAVVYGILRTLPGEAIRAFKNMRMCDDCHWSINMISKLTGRVIMVRDISRFHVMVEGSCSCGVH